uniref:Uncharacterized protein n=1 Tax=Globisporangium ultimum (strain ATCC 200006 / CBS 805.95 / DAOM BR144) TaxID=431595 RepID=K3W748_GLOUD
MTLSRSKSNQLGPATTRKINRSGHPFICPAYQWLCVVTPTTKYVGLQRLTWRPVSDMEQMPFVSIIQRTPRIR